MRVQVNGKAIELTRRDFLAQGGEGAVYVKNRKAYKIYSDTKAVIPEGKVQELSVLSDSKIIRPEALIYEKGKAVGYVMRYISKTHALCRLFTQAFRSRNGMTADMSLHLVRDMQKTVEFIHKNSILIVDLNEMNFLVDKKFNEVYFIDVDSYQTPHYPATAIMESIRDRHASRFSELTDWFSFAVVSFQVLIGIHPYKGKHPKLKGLDERMQANVSVFNKGVKIPHCCVPLTALPPLYRSWFEDVLEKGKREEPPFDISKAIVVKVALKKIAGSDNFTIEEIAECDWDIDSYSQSAFLRSGGGVLYKKRFTDWNQPSAICRYGNARIAVGTDAHDKLLLFNLGMQQPIDNGVIEADAFMVSDGRLYLKSGEHLLETCFHGPEMKPIVSTKLVGNVLERATKLFEGVVIQDLLEAWYASVFPESGICIQVKLDTLKGYKVIEAKYEKGLLMVVGTKKGKYDRFIFSIREGKIGQTRKIEDVSYSGLNFTVLDNGLCACLTEQTEMEVFAVKNILKVKTIQDPVLHGGMKLTNDGGRVLFVDGKKLYSMRMK